MTLNNRRIRHFSKYESRSDIPLNTDPDPTTQKKMGIRNRNADLMLMNIFELAKDLDPIEGTTYGSGYNGSNKNTDPDLQNCKILTWWFVHLRHDLVLPAVRYLLHLLSLPEIYIVLV